MNKLVYILALLALGVVRLSAQHAVVLPGQLVQIASVDGTKMPTAGTACTQSNITYQAASAGSGYTVGQQVACLGGIWTDLGSVQRVLTAPTTCMVGVSPSPWEAGIPPNVYDSNGDFVAEARLDGDALLIAAAPDLLVACVEFVNKCDAGLARSTHSYAQMKAAIAKSNGAKS